MILNVKLKKLYFKMTSSLIEKFRQTLPILEEKVTTFPTEYMYICRPMVVINFLLIF